jgi:hypothetical protein
MTTVPTVTAAVTVQVADNEPNEIGTFAVAVPLVFAVDAAGETTYGTNAHAFRANLADGLESAAKALREEAA